MIAFRVKVRWLPLLLSTVKLRDALDYSRINTAVPVEKSVSKQEVILMGGFVLVVLMQSYKTELCEWLTCINQQ